MHICVFLSDSTNKPVIFPESEILQLFFFFWVCKGYSKEENIPKCNNTNILLFSESPFSVSRNMVLHYKEQQMFLGNITSCGFVGHCPNSCWVCILVPLTSWRHHVSAVNHLYFHGRNFAVIKAQLLLCIMSRCSEQAIDLLQTKLRRFF